MSDVNAFTPAQTVTIAVTTTSGSAAIDAHKENILVTNAGAGLAFIRFGIGAQTATTADTPILPSSAQVFSKGESNTFAAITGTGTATLYVTTGEGV